jgi:hypothetical protein
MQKTPKQILLRIVRTNWQLDLASMFTLLKIASPKSRYVLGNDSTNNMQLTLQASPRRFPWRKPLVELQRYSNFGLSTAVVVGLSEISPAVHFVKSKPNFSAKSARILISGIFRRLTVPLASFLASSTKTLIDGITSFDLRED